MTTPNEMTERERPAFEKAMNDMRFFPRELSFARTTSPSGRDEYANGHLQSCWIGWQARATLPQPSAEPVEAVKLDPVVEANRELLHQRSQFGIKKYGVTLADANLSERELTVHALQEALDLSNYLQGLLQRFDATQSAEIAPAPVDDVNLCKRCLGSGSMQVMVGYPPDNYWYSEADCTDCGGTGETTQQAGWQPIETAPKDGTNVLLVNRKGNIAAGLWQGVEFDQGWWLRGGNGPNVFFNNHHGPTHWQPLPPPPSMHPTTGKAES